MFRALLSAAALTASVVGASTAIAPQAAQAASPDHTVASRTVLSRPASIERTAEGYSYQAWGNDNHLVITQVDAGLKLVDTGHTPQLTSLPDACRRTKVPGGVGAVCDVPGDVSADHPLSLELVLRLGDDYVDASTLPAAFKLSVLADGGRDVIHLGAGDDFVNGAFQRDRVWGGGGNDWIRTGTGGDRIHGEGGNDRLVGVEGRDAIDGGAGDDSVEGGPADDRLWGGAGTDRVSCSTGRDEAHVDTDDRTSGCESVTGS